MSDDSHPNIDLYTRNGFVGPATAIIRKQYNAQYKRAEGTYLPKTLNLFDVEAPGGDRALPTTILDGRHTSFEMTKRDSDMSYALRNVYADELHLFLDGSGSLESDFGVLAVEAGDIVLIPRSTSYRIREVQGELTSLNLVTESTLEVDPDHAPGVLNPDLHLHIPAPYDDPVGPSGEHEVILRHRGGLTSYFYDGDPLRCLAVKGVAQVQKFNIDNVHGLGVGGHGLVKPPRLVNDPTSQTLVYHLGSRKSGRPPIHHNADYDEVIVYIKGPGPYGGIDRPGTITWAPKGCIHQGPEEDVPIPYQAMLFETRDTLALTDPAERVTSLMNPSDFSKR